MARSCAVSVQVATVAPWWPRPHCAVISWKRLFTDHDAYRLTFNLPERIESWISANEERRVVRTRRIKAELLSSITIYDTYGGESQVYRLRYDPTTLRRPASDTATQE
ncbi:hypothetical protein GCM10009838_25000 [Catenulispora subtropica]|uniref:Uncharacterized protein n=1 Tax=Catenulispora subtropica TaxID=450798 RepID=A0ABP5CMU0_9ACTN